METSASAEDPKSPATRASQASERSVAISINQNDGDGKRPVTWDEKLKLWYSIPGKVGTYCSFIIMICGIVASIIAQKYAQDHVSASYWTEDCPSGYSDACKGNGAVYRFSFALFIIFALQLLGTTLDVRFYDSLWVPKMFLFGGFVILFYYSSSSIFDEHGYAWLARILGFFYLILQQVILIDFAYNWNDSWVQKAEDHGGNKWLIILMATSIILIAGSAAAIGVMFWQFKGCDANNVILSLTVVLPTLVTFVQLFLTDQGSLLTSAIMIAYSTYVCYSAITLNPDGECNPTLSTSYQTVSTAIGMILTVISLSWATMTTIKRVPQSLGHDTSIQTGNGAYFDVQSIRTLLQEASIVFILISAYYAMILTNWATLQSSYNISSPKQGQVAMWLQASGQWIAILLYLWTLVAPKLFPDRDFGG